MKKKLGFVTAPLSFHVGMKLPERLSREARHQLNTSVTPPQTVRLAAKAADIAKKSAEQKQAAASA
jgi:hypothetical protein